VSAGSTILPDFLPAEFHRETALEHEAEVETDPVPEVEWQSLHNLLESESGGEKNLYRRALEQFDRVLISRAMQTANGNQAQAAELLGLSRVTLRAKLRSMKLSVEKVLTARGPDQPG
jgi:DNA-binding protein Fis